MRGNLHARFLGEWRLVTVAAYPLTHPMLAEGLSIAMISKLTGLSDIEIEELKIT